MNGFRLLLAFTFMIHVGVAFSAAQDSDPFPPDPSRDFGWQINDGVLEYIVQISPEKARFMQQYGEENLSDMPPELVGRVQRIVVRVGNDVLPKSPSKEEIKRTIAPYMSPNDVTASLGAGKFSELESDSVVNVQSSGLPYPDLPSAPSNSRMSSPPVNGSRGRPSGSTFPQSGDPRTNPSSGGFSDLLPQNRGNPQSMPGSRSTADPSRTGPPSLGTSSGRTPPSTTPNTMPPPTTLPQSGGGASDSVGTFPARNTEDSSRRGQPPAGASGGSPRGGAVPDRDSNNWRSLANSAGSNGAYSGVPGNGVPGNGIPGNRIPGNQVGRMGDSRIAGPPVVGSQVPSLGPSSQAGSNQMSSSQPPSSWGATPGMSGMGGGRTGAAGSYLGLQTGNPNMNRQDTNGNMQNPGFAGGPGYGFNPDSMQPGNNPAAQNANPNSGRYPGGYGDAARSSGDGVTRLAANSSPAAPAGTSAEGSAGQSVAEQNKGQTAQSQTSPSDNSHPTSGHGRQSSGDVWLQIFFLISLIVNFYLGMLIRKLLTRYRSLLSSVRGQAA